MPPEQTGEGFFAYEYHYKDHLGNLRAAFRKAPAIAPFTATMEPASAPLEEALFDNIARTRSSEHALNGPLTGTRHSARVGPMADGTRQVLGPWRTLAVKQGDRLQAQVYAFCLSSAAADPAQRVQLTAFVNPQATPATGEQTQNLWDKLKVGLSFPLASQATAPQDNAVPVAYLKYIFYDQKYNPLKDLIVPVTSAALAANGGWEELSFDIVASEDGYVQVLVANESDKAVWFDDLQIKHSPALIVQENHYDPWGLNLAGIEKQGSPDHKFQYNGGKTERNKDLGLHWDETPLRSYDYQLGRFHQIDPRPDDADQESLTPYQFSLNNPVRYNDPNGDCPTCLTGAIGAGLGALVGGGIEAASQLIEHGEVNDWGAVGGAAAQGFVTGGVAGLTGGASLVTTTLVSSGANVVGGAISNTIQGKEITTQSVITDAAVGAAAGVGGKLLDKAVNALKPNYVYRALDKTDDISKGLTARKPNAGNSPESHVAGKKASQWISTTKDKHTALTKYNSGAGVVRINLKKVGDEVVDASNGFAKPGRVSNYAKKDQEVLIKNHIPKKAIKEIL